MWSVSHPDFDAGETYALCISRVRNVGLRRRLNAIRGAIEAASVDYEVHGDNATLHQVAASPMVGAVTADELVAVYDQRMAGKSGPGRGIYDHIKMLPKGDRCPFCDQRNVSTLDHVLPKAEYPSLAVAPLNLVGACMECNNVKKNLAPINAVDVVLHPYFDDITGTQWLKASVVQQIPCALTFSVVPPPAWSATLTARAINQFSLLGLASLYSSEAARELANIRHNLAQHFGAGGAAAVKAELTRQWHSRRMSSTNSWQTAMYEAISRDDWFCDGGFAQG